METLDRGTGGEAGTGLIERSQAGFEAGAREVDPEVRLLVTYLGEDPSAFDDPVAALKNALLFLFTEDGIPCLYYGTEQGFSGGNDPANREDLWLSGYDTQHPLFVWIKRLTALRKGYRALMVGEQRVLYSSDRTGDADEDAGIFAFERGEPSADYAIVVFNTHPSKDTVR